MQTTSLVLVRGKYMLTPVFFNTKPLSLLPTQCIYVFCVAVRTNSDYFSNQH